ncbi:hypothetical protein QBC46DRAFT_412315 [Diplogelasinospora grovesii]|uniref:Uncharacterized protein n=1 Tax=Diplogelasinospora grovesii TaxID=303347 RepID=A0AAN6N0X5_9PEZI|nr:hypothetical protein QBC46DRAFT_412315 [Diplogelasinospora grovesii]
MARVPLPPKASLAKTDKFFNFDPFDFDSDFPSLEKLCELIDKKRSDEERLKPKPRSSRRRSLPRRRQSARLRDLRKSLGQSHGIRRSARIKAKRDALCCEAKPDVGKGLM